MRKCVKTALSITGATLTVLGAQYEEHLKELRHLKTRVAFNLDWNKGMVNSVKFGLHELNKYCPGLEAVIVITCHEHFLCEDLLNDLIASHDKGNFITATMYRGDLVLPAIFDHGLFKQMLKMDDNCGLKELIGTHGITPVIYSSVPANVTIADVWKIL